MNTLAQRFDDLPCAVALIGDDGVLLEVNARLAEWLGGDAPSWQGRPVGALFPQAGSLLYQTYVFPLLKMGRQVDEVSITLKHTSGVRVDALLCARRVVQDGIGVVRCVFLRIQERRRLEDQLLAAKRAADQAPGLLFQLRRAPRSPAAFAYVTDAVRVLFGVLPSQVLQSAEAIWQLVHPDDLDAVLASLDESARSLQPWRCEFRVGLASGEGWREIHATPLREPDDTLLWNGYMADITERKSMESSLREKAGAEQANRAKSEFLSRMSHELRTPLNGILGFAHLLQTKDAGNLRPDQLGKLGYIETAGKSLLRLINEVLEISRIEAGHTQMLIGVVKADEVIDASLHLADPLAILRGVQLVREGEIGALVQADADRLGQVLLNLLSNAIKYGPANGVVRVQVCRVGQAVHIEVQDQGAGLSAQQQSQLFQPFNRLGAERTHIEGAGLGLVITRGLVQLMGGDLRVRSEPGQGACFSVCLVEVQPEPVPEPLNEQAWRVSPGPDALADGPHAPPEQTRRVLYVEDNPINALLMQAVFEASPEFQLAVVDSGERACQAVRHACPDVLLLDMHLPDMGGIELLAKLRAECGVAHVPAIAVSADAMPDDLREAREAGFADYWTKPLDVTRIAPTLRALLAARVTAGGTMLV